MMSQSSARASSPSISSGKVSAPAMEVERLAMGSGFGFTSKAGLRVHEPRLARNPWLRRWSSVLPSATEAITRLKSS